METSSALKSSDSARQTTTSRMAKTFTIFAIRRQRRNALAVHRFSNRLSEQMERRPPRASADPQHEALRRELRAACRGGNVGTGNGTAVGAVYDRARSIVYSEFD